jgi:hypothetical protein
VDDVESADVRLGTPDGSEIGMADEAEMTTRFPLGEKPGRRRP